MSIVFAVTNQKGGVGKTTTSVNLAASLAATKRKILLVDMDPQGNATMGSGVDKASLERSVYDVLLGEAGVKEAMVKVELSEYWVLGSNVDLTGAEVELLDLENREFRLKQALADVQQEFDFIIVDCPPSLSLLTINGLVAADGMIIPMQCEYYALEGLTALLDTLSRIKQALNPELKISGIIRTMYDPRNSLTMDVSRQLEEHFGAQLLRTVIPRNVRLAEAPSYGVPVLYHDKLSRGATAYLAMAGEIVRRHLGQTNDRLTDQEISSDSGMDSHSIKGEQAGGW